MANKKYLIVGAGGFIGGHIAKKLLDEGNTIIAVDIKPKQLWFQNFSKVKCYDKTDMKEYNNCLKTTSNVDYVINMACNMGGMGFIENNKTECMLSVLINTNLLRACLKNKVKKYFFSSSACVYNIKKQKTVFIKGLKEEDAYPAMPEDGYGWEKLFSERMCRHFMEDFGLEVRVARYHNVYGPMGTYDGGREKAPAALCRKIAIAVINKKKEIEIWGDGEQTRSFLYIDDCIQGTMKLFNSNHSEPLNIGSNQQVSINQMVDVIEKIAGVKNLKRNYLLDKPKGVRGRSSNNKNAIKALNWQYKISLEQGLTKTYNWIYSELKKDSKSSNKYTQF
jgi:nucleoside-diphosphate-sugar epimerase